MRIIIILSSLLPGGAERVSLDLAQRLLEAGNEVHLFIAKITRDCPAVYEIPEGATVHYLHHGARSRIVRAIGNAMLLKQVIHRIAPEWIISLGAQYKLLALCGILDSCKVLLSERNYPPAFYSRGSLELARKCYVKATKVVFQTKDASSYFPELRPSQIEIIPNAANESAAVWQGFDSKHIAFVGRLSPQKNPSMLIEAFALFLTNHKNYVLDLYGDGELRAKLEMQVESMQLTGCVVFHGHTKNIQRKISSALMYVSTSDYEGISNSMLEALSMGMPCVCTDCGGGGARLAIRSGEDGLLVPCGDALAMAEAMARIADSPVFAKQLGDAARESSSIFNPSLIYSQWLDVLGAK